MYETLMKEMLAEYGADTLKGIQHFIPDKEPRKYLVEPQKVKRADCYLI